VNAEEWIRSLNTSDGGSGAGPAWRPGGGRLMRGTVLADSAVQSFDALRAASVAEQRQVVIAAGPHMVAIELAPLDSSDTSDSSGSSGSSGSSDSSDRGDADSHGSWRIARGRVDGPGVVAVQVVAHTGVEVALAIPDEFGEFEFEIPAGRWLLVVSDDDHDVEVSLDVD
jgi:hypothetical protein